MLKTITFIITLALLSTNSKAMASYQQLPPVMNGSGSFLGAPIPTGPGYLQPDPTPFILDSVLPAPRSLGVAQHLAQSHRWALEVSKQYSETNLYQKAYSLLYQNAELRLNIKREKASRFINDIYIRGGENMIFLQDMIDGSSTESALHAQNTTNYLLEQIRREIAKEEKYYNYVKSLLTEEKVNSSTLAATDVIARGWYGTLLAIDRLTSYTSLTSTDIDKMVNFASTRMQYYLNEQVNQSKKTTLTLPDRKRSVASAEGVLINPLSINDPENQEYGLHDLMITYQDSELESILANLNKDVKVLHLNSVRDNLGNKYYTELGSNQLQNFRVGELSDKSFISSSLLQASKNRLNPNYSKITTYESSQNDTITEKQYTVTDINTAPLITDGFLVDTETFNLIAPGKQITKHIIIDVKVDAVGARTLASIRSLAYSGEFEIKEHSPSPSPFEYLNETDASQLLAPLNFTANENGSLNLDQNFIQTQLSMVNIPFLGRIFCSKLASRQFSGAMMTSSILGYTADLNRSEFGGCYNPRFIGDSTVPSYHTRGLAIDINVPGNSLGTFGDLDDKLVTIFKSWGLRWGGDWVAIDPMHFELAALISPQP